MRAFWKKLTELLFRRTGDDFGARLTAHYGLPR